MKLINQNAEIFILNNSEENEELNKTTHMCISAHHDDIEIMAYNGILECFHKKDKRFFGVVVTNGSGSARSGAYSHYTDDDMKKIRKLEQKKAAIIGDYVGVAFLDYPSSTVKNSESQDVILDIKSLILTCNPEVVYTHNLADKHDTHIGVVVKTIEALREIEPEKRPKKLFGCEVWRSLDWLLDDDKVINDVSSHPNLANALVEVFDSQVAGGKRYDLAAIGRRRANATYLDSHLIDNYEQVTYAMDLTPLIKDDSLDIIEYVVSYIERFKNDVILKVKSTVN